MSVVTLSFERLRPKDGTGHIVNESVPIPTMRGHKNADSVWMIQQLSESLESLSETPCSFWACDGPTRPQNMATCGKCWAMRQIANVKQTLERSLEMKGNVPARETGR